MKPYKIMYYASVYFGRVYLREVKIKETPKQFRVLNEPITIYGPTDYVSNCYSGQRFSKPSNVLFPTLKDALEHLGTRMGKHIGSLTEQLARAKREEEDIKNLLIDAVNDWVYGCSGPAPAE